MILMVLVRKTLLSTILPVIIFNFPLLFRISLLFIEIYLQLKALNTHCQQTKGKLKIMRDNVGDYCVMHTLTTSNMNLCNSF